MNKYTVITTTGDYVVEADRFEVDETNALLFIDDEDEYCALFSPNFWLKVQRTEKAKDE